MGSSASPATQFSLLPKTRTPWTEFVFSTAAQTLAVALLLWLRLLYPTVISPPEHSFRSVQLVSTPVPVNHQPQPVHLALIQHLDPPADALRLPAPQPRPQSTVEKAPVVMVTLAAKLEALPIRTAPVIPKQAVRTNLFSSGSSAAPTVAQVASHVQTGGFGDPNGIVAKSGQSKAVNVASLGSFDLPSGPGAGNGTAGARGTAGVIPSSGFGSEVAAPVHPHIPGTTQVSGFDSASVPAAASVRSHAERVAAAVPAEILSKPTPIYTQEAKSLRIEGEVLLEVVLEASGSLHVMRVLRGLGHGLDDNAVKAAEEIRFKPAMRDGRPTDSTVVLHIIFQLA